MTSLKRLLWSLLATPFAALGWSSFFIYDSIVTGWKIAEDDDEQLWRGK